MSDVQYRPTRRGAVIDGYTVGDRIPNQDSIAASLYDYSIVGLRVVDDMIEPEEAWRVRDSYTKELAERIEESRRIDPLIVVIDEEGPYILEGSHRFDALHLLGVTRFPALVVLDETEIES